MSHADFYMKRIPSRVNSKCKDAEAGTSLAGTEKNKKEGPHWIMWGK